MRAGPGRAPPLRSAAAGAPGRRTPPSLLPRGLPRFTPVRGRAALPPPRRGGVSRCGVCPPPRPAGLRSRSAPTQPRDPGSPLDALGAGGRCPFPPGCRGSAQPRGDGPGLRLRVGEEAEEQPLPVHPAGVRLVLPQPHRLHHRPPQRGGERYGAPVPGWVTPPGSSPKPLGWVASAQLCPQSLSPALKSTRNSCSSFCLMGVFSLGSGSGSASSGHSVLVSVPHLSCQARLSVILPKSA